MKTAVVAGYTGLVGNELLNILVHSIGYDSILCVGRKKSTIESDKITYIYSDLEVFEALPADNEYFFFCCIGTTIKKAKTKENFKHVDYTLVLNFAAWAKKNSAKYFGIVSAMGANSGSSIFYNRVKGETERDLQNLQLKSLYIFRPSLLLGNREEYRLGEKIGMYAMKILDLLPYTDNIRAISARRVAESMLYYSLHREDGNHIVNSGNMQNLKN